MKKYILDFENVRKEYDGKVILGDIDFCLAEGEFLTVVGPSGCGKSTLLRMILGQERPTSANRFLIDGREISHPDITCGIVYQGYSLFPHMTALGNVMFGRRPELDCKAHRKKAMEYLERVGMAEHANKYPVQLSGGHRQRVAIAQTLIVHPRIILMDEPFSALDPITRESLQKFMLEIWRDAKITIIFITHVPEEAFFLGSRLVGLSQYFAEGMIDSPDGNHGARIVFDVEVSKLVDKTTRDFKAAVQRLRDECLEAGCVRHVKNIILEHPDAIMTLTSEQKGECYPT